jgi:AcrR family transcriptional regulator
MPKFTRRAAERPDEILDAALARFVSSGFAATRIDEIAADAGVTVGTIYRYFPSKESLVTALISRPRTAEWHRGRDVSEAYGSFTARQILELLVRRWIAELELPPNLNLLLVVSREAARFPAEAGIYVNEQLALGRVGFGRTLRHGMDRGEFGLIDVDAVADSLTQGLLAGLAWQHSFEADSPLPLLDGMIRGLPRSGSESSTGGERITRVPDSPTDGPIARGQVRVVTLAPPSRSNR